ncbi:MAG: DUF4175 family protein [Paracoccaceae bacterium]
MAGLNSQKNAPRKPDFAQLAPYSGRLFFTRLTLWAETLITSFWPLASLAAASAAMLLLRFEQFVPQVYWLFIATGVLVLALVLGGIGLRRVKPPSRIDAILRLDSELPGRPLTALLDRPAHLGDDHISKNLWLAHTAAMRQAAARARVPKPVVNLRERDPNGLRLLAATALGVALVFSTLPVANTQSGGPAGTALAAIPAASFEAWARPPAYTGLPVMYLSPENLAKASLELPIGSEFTLRLYGIGDFALEDGASGQNLSLAPDAFDLGFNIAQSGRVTLRNGGDLMGDWRITARADTPPLLQSDATIAKSRGGAMELEFTAQDDYAITGGSYMITLDLGAVDRRFGLVATPDLPAPLTGRLPLPFRGGRADIKEMLEADFSQHLFANLPVVITLEVADGAGQLAELTRHDVLPARSFFDPLAAAIIEQRRDLLWAPDNLRRVNEVLRAISFEPEPGLFPSASSYLLTRVAIRRMGYMAEDGLSVAERDEIAALLWDVAVMIEAGDLSSAEARLRRAQERLREGLQNNATPQELADLTDELREAIDEYLQQMAREMQQNGDQQQAENQQSGPTMSQNQLQELLDRIEEMNRNGQRDEAQRLLDQLNQFMENMQMTQQQTPGGQGAPGEGVQDTLRQQQELSDDAFRRLQEEFRENGQGGNGQTQNPEGEPGAPPTSEELSERQEALREFMRRLQDDGADAEALREAERNMAEARDRLREGDLSGALDEQAQAMENLRRGIRELEAQDRAGNNGEDNPANARDPLGRPVGNEGGMDQGETAVPDQNASERARELLEEIRRRAADRLRPQGERDYLQRLLDLF